MTRVVLLDVNFLVALFDPDHIHHETAHAWFSANRRGGWVKRRYMMRMNLKIEGGSMVMKRWIVAMGLAVPAALLAAGQEAQAPAPTKAPSELKKLEGDVDKDAKKVGQDVSKGAKDAGKAVGTGAKKVGEGASKAGKAVGEGASKAGKATVEGAKDAGKAVGTEAKKTGEAVSKEAKKVTGKEKSERKPTPKPE